VSFNKLLKQDNWSEGVKLDQVHVTAPACDTWSPVPANCS